MAEQVRYHGGRQQLMQLLRGMPALLSGRVRNAVADTDTLLAALGVEMLSITRDAYVVKARGGTDEAGIQWKPLDPRYIAYRRRHPGLNARRGRARRAGREMRPLLTAAQDKRWRGIFASTFRRLQSQGVGNAGSQAAALAWAILKRQGARTILSEYGGTTVEIGRDTGRLLASLSPTAPGNILRTGPGEVTVGTNVEYAAGFHARRPILPDADHFPETWWRRLSDILADGLETLLRKAMGGAP